MGHLLEVSVAVGLCLQFPAISDNREDNDCQNSGSSANENGCIHDSSLLSGKRSKVGKSHRFGEGAGEARDAQILSEGAHLALSTFMPAAILMTAGASSTMKMQGKMNRTRGKMILILVLTAASSAC